MRCERRSTENVWDFFHGINTLLLSYNMYKVVQFSCMMHLSYLCKLTYKKLFIKDVFCLIKDTLFWLTYLFGFYGVHYNGNMIWKFIISVFPCFYSREGGKGGGSLPGGAYTLLYLDYTLSMFIYCTVLYFWVPRIYLGIYVQALALSTIPAASP